MKTIPAALTWELFERGKWTLPGAFLTGNALAVVLLAALRHDGAINPEDPSMVAIHVTMLFVNAMVFGSGAVLRHGESFAAAPFPAPNSVIVAWQLLPAMAAMALECLLSTAAINAHFQSELAALGPGPVHVRCTGGVPGRILGDRKIALAFFQSSASPY